LGAAGPSARPSVSQQWAANEDVATSAKDVPRLENAFSMMRKRERTREREEEGHREEERMREREDDREREREERPIGREWPNGGVGDRKTDKKSVTRSALPDMII
jgi:hypothetical protein